MPAIHRAPALAVALLAALMMGLAVGAPAARASNGCGPGGFGPLVPDRPLGVAFEAACDRHDDCYATPWRDVAGSRPDAKSACDSRFHDDLGVACRDAIPEAPRRLAWCLDVAWLYFRAVRSWLGEVAYAGAQA